MNDTTHLSDVIDSIIDGDTEQAKTSFHAHVRDKMREQLGMNDPELTQTDEES